MSDVKVGANPDTDKRSALRAALLREAGLQSAEVTRIPRRLETDSAPLSFAQERLWFLDQLDPGKPHYNVSRTVRLEGRLDAVALERSINEIVRRHEVFRTSFVMENGAPVQRIAPSSAVTLGRIDLERHKPEDRETRSLEIAVASAVEPFDLSRGPFLRATLIRLSDEDHVLALITHHIVSDGWSRGVLLRELGSLYADFKAGRSPSLPELPIQYADYAVWQRSWLSGGRLERELKYWVDRLDGAPPLLNLPADRSRPAVQNYRGASTSIRLSPELTAAIHQICRQEGTTLFITLLAAFKALIVRYTGLTDIVVGAAIAGRGLTELEGLIGFFVNTLVLRTDASGDPGFLKLLVRLRDTAVGAYAHQDVPFEKLVEHLHPERNLSYIPLVQVAFLQSPRHTSISWPELEVRPVTVDRGTSKFDLSVEVSESEEGVTVNLEFSSELFDVERMERLLKHYRALLTGVVADPEMPISRIPLLDGDERRQLIEGWNDTKHELPSELSLHQLIEQQTDRTPDAVAVCYEQQTLTYQELEQRSNRLANYLQAHGVGPDTCVGLCSVRSVEMVVGLLGILKAGGAYVPLDPGYPAERLEHMVDDARLSVILTQRAHRHAVPERRGVHVICLDTEWNAVEAHGQERPTSTVSPDNLAYVIFTSGSTGKPKGAMNSHRAICNRLLWMQHAYKMAATDKVLQKTPYSFDVSVWEFFWPLVVGAQLVIAPPDMHKDAAGLVDLIQATGITTLHFVPSMLQVFVDAPGVSHCTSIRHVICSGEALPATLVSQFSSRLSAELHNLYGPTEAAVDVSYWPCPQSGSIQTVPIGRPVWNTQLYILDPRLSPTPLGVSGELYIGGVQVARGYLNRPDLTADRFVPDPISSEPGARMYRTGDAVKFLPDGNIEYLGRLDFQVKIRGHRIELGEIESAIRELSAVKDTIVLAREDEPGQKRLVAYIVPGDDMGHEDDDASGAEQTSEQVAQWKIVFDDNYSTSTDSPDPTFDITGWNSSYTGEKIPDDEMREWVEQTCSSILEDDPKRVLEVGCGTGLLLFRVAPQCSYYVGSDFSSTVISRILQLVSDSACPLPHVELLQRSADELSDLPHGSFDTIIINSVIQYFPSLDYLLEVLRGLIPLCAPNGRIFLGDIRNFAVREALAAAVEIGQAADEVVGQELQQRVRRRLAKDEELLIEPAFFPAFLSATPELGDVELRVKRGQYHNELTRYRYDVVLQVGPRLPDADALVLDAGSEAFDLTAVERTIEADTPLYLVVRGVVDGRTAAEVAAADLLASYPPAKTIAGLRAEIDDAAASGWDPERFWSLGERTGYKVTVWPARDRSGRVDVCFRRCDAPPVSWLSALGASAGAATSLGRFASDPLKAKLAARMVPRLRQYLEGRLPAVMCPSAYVLLDALPLNSNGKVDRKALPSPDPARPMLIEQYLGPRTPIEEGLCGIWAEVLRVERVGIRDNFFDLGGHSLLATQVITRIPQNFGVDLKLRALFESPTVAGLASVILQTQAIRDVEEQSELDRILMEMESLTEDEVRDRLTGDGPRE